MENMEKNNGGLIAIIIILVVALIGAGLYIAYDKGIIFNNEPEVNENEDNKENNQEENEIVETEIINEVEKQKLNDMVDIMKNYYGIAGEIYNTSSTITADNLDLEKTTALILKYYWFKAPGESMINFATDPCYGTEGLMASYVTEQHNKLFNKNEIKLGDIATGTLKGQTYYEYTYDQNARIFKHNTCMGGGTGCINDGKLSYINKYTSDNENSYVYVNVAVLDSCNKQIYTNIEKNTLYKTYESYEDIFTVDNYKDFSEYKYTFGKREDGSYYFKSIERIK